MADSPQFMSYQVPNWCSIAPRSFLMTGFFVEWFKHHFSKESWIEHPELRTILWKSVITDSKLYIESATRYVPEETEKRPSIVVKRDDWVAERLGIEDRAQGDLDLTGIDHFERLISGSHTLFCASPLPAQAEILGMEVYREMSQFGPHIRRMLNLHRFLPTRVGALSQLEEARKVWVVPVPVAYAYTEKWTLIPHTPKIKRIVLSMFA